MALPLRQVSFLPDKGRRRRRIARSEEFSERTLVSPLALRRPAGRIIYWSVFAFLLLSTLVSLGPVYWMASGALKSSVEIFQTPPTIWPSVPHWNNYSE